MQAAAGWTATRWGEGLEPYFAERKSIGTSADARGPQLFAVDEGPGAWRLRQIFDDLEGDHDSGISATVDLPASDRAAMAVVSVNAVDQL